MDLRIKRGIVPHCGHQEILDRGAVPTHGHAGGSEPEDLDESRREAVSGAAARLREAGSVLAEPDPADRRRQLLRRDPALSARRRVASADITPAVAAALGDQAALPEVVAALETLNRHLTPAAIRRLTRP